MSLRWCHHTHLLSLVLPTTLPPPAALFTMSLGNAEASLLPPAPWGGCPRGQETDWLWASKPKVAVPQFLNLKDTQCHAAWGQA